MHADLFAAVDAARLTFKALIDRPAQLADPIAAIEARQAARLAGQAPAAASAEPAAAEAPAPAPEPAPAARPARRRARRPLAQRGALALPGGASWGDDAF